MKTMIISAFVFLFLQDLSAAPRVVREWLTAFEVHTVTHDQQALLGDMFPAYRKEQHDEFHQGNTERFLMEMYCGNSQGGFICPESLEDITDIRLMGMQRDKAAGGYRVRYQVGLKGGVLVDVEWLLRMEGKRPAGIEGARG